MIAGLVIAQNLQAAAVRACPHHGEVEHGAVDGPSEAPHPGHHAPAPDSDSHDGPCDCLGPCGASAAIDAPASPTESAFAEVAPRRILVPNTADSGLARHPRAFVLPYPNAPPA